MYLFYSFLLTAAFLALLPYFAWQALSNRKYVNNLRERLGRLPASWRADARPALWVQAVSVGEALAARSLVSALRERFPQHRLIVSTTTGTGQAVARARITEADGVCYFPFDWRFAVRRALDVIRPEAVILLESELWPNFLRECEQRRIPVLLANGRISDRSFRRSVRFAGLLRQLLYSKVTRGLMQSAVDAERAVQLGAAPARVSVSGNLKYDIGESEPPQLASSARLLDEIFALSRAPLIVAGSTTEGEEELLLAAFAAVRRTAGLENVRLLLAPRHPERFAEVAQLLAGLRCNFVRRSTYAAELVVAGASAGQLAEAQRRQDAQIAEMILLDSIGELAALYALAAVVFIGGSLVPKGGHNVLEPALYAKPIIVGPHMENFREIAAELQRRAALWQLRSANEQELSAVLIELLTQPERAATLGANARAAIDDNRGATARTVEAVAALLAEWGV